MLVKIKQRIMSGTGRSATIKRNIVGSILIKGVSIATSFLLVPLTLGYVSSEIYGIWLTLSSILFWLTYMDVGFTLGLKNRLTEALAQKNYERGKKLVSTTYFIITAIFLPLSIILITICPYVDWCNTLNISPANQDTIVRTIRLLIVFVSLQMIANVFVAVVSAHQKTALASLFNVIGQICSLIIVWLMTLYIAPSLSNLAFAYSFMPIVIVFSASFIFYSKSMKQIAPSIKSIDKRHIKDLWGLGMKFFVIQIQMIVLYQATNVIISNIAGPESVTQYNIAYKLLNTVVMIYSIILTPLWPAFTDAYAKLDYTWMNHMYKKMSKVFGVLCMMIIVLVAASPIVFKLWIGDKVEIPFLLTVSIAIYTLIHCWDSLQATLINGTGKIRLQSYVVIIGLVFHIPLALFLSRYIGIYGVITSMCIINFIYACFFTTQIRKIISQKAKGIWEQ